MTSPQVSALQVLVSQKRSALHVPLQPHGLSEGRFDRSLEVSLIADEHGVTLRYLWLGSSSAIIWPQRGAGGVQGLQPERRDFLWHHTCAEWFIGETGSPAYIEFNFSPSGHWAAYRFADYRQSLGDLEWAGPPPEIDFSLEPQRAELCAKVPWTAFTIFAGATVRQWQLGFTCVVERRNGSSPDGAAIADTSSGSLEYWAVTHPRAQPEFHDRRGFSVLW